MSVSRYVRTSVRPSGFRYLSYFLYHVTLNLEGSLRLVRPQKSFSDFNDILIEVDD